MSIHDLQIEEEVFATRDGTWEGSPHGMSNNKPVVIDLSTFTKAEHYPDGYLRDGIALALLTGGANAGKYGAFTRGGADGLDTMAGALFDNPQAEVNGVLKTNFVMGAMVQHGKVIVANMPNEAGGTPITAADLPKLMIER